MEEAAVPLGDFVHQVSREAVAPSERELANLAQDPAPAGRNGV
jgi:hypothetical protein